MTGCLVKTFVCEERRRRNCSEADETADMQGKERKEMRNPRNEPPGTGRRFGDLLGGPDFGQPFLTDDYSTALSSSTRLAYSLPTVNSSPFSIRNELTRPRVQPVPPPLRISCIWMLCVTPCASLYSLHISTSG